MWYAKHVCRQNFYPFLHLPSHCAPQQQSHWQSQCFFIPFSSWKKCLLPGPQSKLTDCGCYISVPLGPQAQILFCSPYAMWRRKGLRVGGFPGAVPTFAILTSPIHTTEPLQKAKRGKNQTSKDELLGYMVLTICGANKGASPSLTALEKGEENSRWNLVNTLTQPNLTIQEKWVGPQAGPKP